MDTIGIGTKLKKYLDEKGLTQQKLAKLARVDQSQVSRIINGEFKRISKNVERICRYAKIDTTPLGESHNPAESPDLMEAISLVWDGSPKKAKAIAKVIRSLKELS